MDILIATAAMFFSLGILFILGIMKTLDLLNRRKEKDRHDEDIVADAPVYDLCHGE